MVVSSTLKVEPEGRKKQSLPYELKKVLQKRCGGVIHQIKMDESDIPYLSGLRDSEVLGAEELIEYIHKYSSVILNEEF